jgi:hypothetical protein
LDVAYHHVNENDPRAGNPFGFPGNPPGSDGHLRRHYPGPRLSDAGRLECGHHHPARRSSGEERRGHRRVRSWELSAERCRADAEERAQILNRALANRKALARSGASARSSGGYKRLSATLFALGERFEGAVSAPGASRSIPSRDRFRSGQDKGYGGASRQAGRLSMLDALSNAPSAMPPS